jgi:excisionase family DNA binding protein
MVTSQHSQLSVVLERGRVKPQDHALEPPVNVKEAAKFRGVSPQTVYLWVERKQIPHLRVMGRNIRFLKSDLESFRASFRQEMVNE